MVYRLVTLRGSQGIQCLECGYISYNANDIKKKYCGNCHKFHVKGARYVGA
jgi:RNase P subunit RPR2